MGSVYDSWFQMGERLKELGEHTMLSPGRIQVLVEKWEARWAYAHQPLHAAAYALNPEHIKALTLSCALHYTLPLD